MTTLRPNDQLWRRNMCFPAETQFSLTVRRRSVAPLFPLFTLAIHTQNTDDSHLYIQAAVSG
jgi:hypothetical protein